MFAFAFVPMLGFVGGAIDYSRGTASLAQLNAAADATALSAVTKARLSPTHTLPSDATLRNFFNASAGSNLGSTINSFSVSCVNSAGSTVSCAGSLTGITVKIAYTAVMDTVFMRVLAVQTMALAGSATASTSYPPYIDFHLLLDNSPSMGLAATVADQNTMKAVTGSLYLGSCEFACHEPGLNPDYYTIAKRNGVTLRIDELRNGVQALFSSAISTQTLPNQYRFALNTFSNDMIALAPLSSDLTGMSATAATIDMVNADNNNHWQTSYDVVMPKINAQVAASGDGTTPSQPQKFVFIVTDGVENESQGMRDGNSRHTATVIDTMNTSWCDAMKNVPKNITVAVLYTSYNPVTSGVALNYYNSYVSPINSGNPTTIQQRLKACATTGFYFETGPSLNINQALQAMFNQATKSSRLTN